MMKLKYVAAAVTLAVSGNVNAAIFNGTTQATGPGELFVSVWDATAQLSYHLDLGVTTEELRTLGTGSYTFDLAADTTYGALLGSTNNLTYQVMGASNPKIGRTGPYDDFGLFTTSAIGADVSGVATYQGITQVFQKLQAHENNMNGDAGDLSNYAANNSAISDGAAGDLGYAGAANWGYSASGLLPFSTFVDVGTEAAFWQIGTTTGRDGVAAALANWNLSSVGELTYNVSAVPVPPAVWLFGSGLLGLVGVARRKQQA